MPEIFEIPENPYIINVENGVETVRLVEQDRFFTQAMGGLLPEQSPDVLPDHASVLDLACGPGLWACELAFAHHEQHITVCGVDLSQTMVRYARAVAQSQGVLEYTDFRTMDVRQRLRFEANSFDLVNARFLASILDTPFWPVLLAECRRILKPGGIIRLTECEMTLSSSPALQQLMSLFTHALWKQGRTFSVDGQTFGMAHYLGKLLLDASFECMRQRAFLLDISSYQPWHYHLVKTIDVTFTLLQPYLVASGLVEEEALRDLMQQMLIEMLAEDFTCVSFGLTTWARQPAAEKPVQPMSGI